MSDKLEALLLAVEEIDNCWVDEGDHIEWNSKLLSERLISLRKAYYAYEFISESILSESRLSTVRAILLEAARKAKYDMDGLSGNRAYFMPNKTATNLHTAIDRAIDLLGHIHE